MCSNPVNSRLPNFFLNVFILQAMYACYFQGMHASIEKWGNRANIYKNKANNNIFVWYQDPRITSYLMHSNDFLHVPLSSDLSILNIHVYMYVCILLLNNITLDHMFDWWGKCVSLELFDLRVYAACIMCVSSWAIQFLRNPRDMCTACHTHTAVQYAITQKYYIKATAYGWRKKWQSEYLRVEKGVNHANTS